MGFSIFILSLLLVWAIGIGIFTWLLLSGVSKGVCLYRRVPYNPSKRLVRALRIGAGVPAAAVLCLLLNPYWYPNQTTFVSPDGKYAVMIGIREYLFDMERLCVKITLRDVMAGQTLATVRHKIRDVFLVGFYYNKGEVWEPPDLYVEWNDRPDALEKARVVYAEMNVTILLPSGTWESPIPDYDQRAHWRRAPPPQKR